MQEVITYGIHETMFGDAVIAQSEKGLCWLGFMVSKENGAYKGDGLERLKRTFQRSDINRDDDKTRALMNKIIHAWEADELKSILLDLRGTEFQCAVWKALLNIPRGKVISYGEVANDIGKPKASRAVGSAVGENPVSLIVPCHRVVQASGGLGNYGWGVPLKEKMLKMENAI